MSIAKLFSFNNLSVTTKIYILITVAIIPISVSTLSSLGYIYYQGEKGKLNHFEELITRVAKKIDETIDEKNNKLEQISKSEEIIALLSNQEQNKSQSSTITESLNKFENFITSKNTQNHLNLLNKKAECVTSCNISVDIKENQNLPIFKKALQGENYVTLLINEKNQKTEMLISHPVKSKKGEIIGVIILRLDEKSVEKYIWSGFSKLLSEIPDSKVFLINQNNLMIIKTEKSPIFQQIITKGNQNEAALFPLLNDKTFINQLVNHQPNIYHKISHNRIYVSTLLANKKWVIGIDLPKNIALNNLFLIIIINVTLFIVVGTITILTALYLGKNISKPINLLTRIAQAVDRGDFEEVAKIQNILNSKKKDLRTRRTKSTNKDIIILNKSIKFQDDLAQLIRIFIQMANRVEQREQNLQRQVKKLNIKLEIDQKKKLKDVKNLTENDEFKKIKSIVTMLKNNN